MFKFFKVFLYSSTIIILFLLDYTKETGVVDLLKKYCCRVVCSVVKTIKEAKIDVDFPLLLREGTFMVVVMMIIRALTKVRGKNKIDKLLENSEAVKEADYFLDKWRMRKTNNQSKNSSYLAAELVEVPILRMAFVEATSPLEPTKSDRESLRAASGGRGRLRIVIQNTRKHTTNPVIMTKKNDKVKLKKKRVKIPTQATSDRNQFERGDAADTIYMSDTTVLSMSSLFDDDLSMFSDDKDINFDERQFWDVTEGNFG